MCPRYNTLRLALALLLVSALNADAQELVRVTRVIDGDTIVLESGERVRLLGVNAPEVNNPKKPVEAFGKEAADFTRRMVEGKLVRLELDPNVRPRNKRSRTLAYVFLRDGTFLNAEIIKQGYGFAVTTFPPLKYEYDFRKLEVEARENRRGLWAMVRKGE
jgi:micrococcal nuclease